MSKELKDSITDKPCSSLFGAANDFVGMCVGRFVYFFVGTDSMRGYDSNTMKDVY